MAVQLVVATSSFTEYPGGVIALKAEDWMAGARGTLSSEADARAISGTAVRDSQTVATSIFSSATAAFTEADDTLEIDFSLLPLLVGMTYQVWFSLVIEGDWDTTNSDTFRSADQHRFEHGCGLAWKGTVGHTTDATRVTATYMPRDRPHYVLVGSDDDTGDVAGTETLLVRAYAQSGTTIEFLIDQVFLIPLVTSGIHAGEWESIDFAQVGGSWNVNSGSIDITNGDFVDGADGGDLNGKFTWSPIPTEDSIFFGDANIGGGDYQKDPDDEYMVRVVHDDGIFCVNSQGSGENPLWAYSAHGSNFREAKTWVDDEFTRTVTEGTGAGRWGTGPQGFGWFTQTVNGLMSVNGAQGVMKSNNPTGTTSCVAALSPSLGGSQAAAQINAPNYTISGTLEIPTPPVGNASDPVISKVVLFGRAGAYPDFELVFDHQGDDWTIESGGGNVFHGPNAFPSQFMGWKMEIRRHRLRVKVWDAGGAEPGTWDYDDFPPNGPDNYSYGDNLEKSTEFVAFYPALSLNTADQFPLFSVLWDDILIDYDPYGDPGDMTATMETPQGTDVGDIDIPYGAYQLVSWGSRNWTSFIPPFDGPYLDFSSKVWNESGVAELQRAEALLYFFRSIHGGIISMNWREADRSGVATRVLVGGSGR